MTIRDDDVQRSDVGVDRDGTPDPEQLSVGATML